MLKTSNKHKRKAFLYFLDESIRYQKLGLDLLSILEAIRHDKQSSNKCPWLETLLISLYQGIPIIEAIENLKEEFHQLDYACFIISLKTNTFDKFTHSYAVNMKNMAQSKHKIKQQAIYPLFLICLGIIIMLGLHFFVLPEYQKLTQGLGLTKDLSHMTSYTLKICFLIIAILTLALFFFPKFKWMVLPILQAYEIIEWAAAIEMGLDFNLPLIDCLILVDNHLKLSYLKDFHYTLILNLRLGKHLQDIQGKAPRMLQQAFEVSHLDHDFFSKLRLKYQNKVMVQLEQIERYIQPVLLGFVGLVCTYFFYTLYQPLLHIPAM